MGTTIDGKTPAQQKVETKPWKFDTYAKTQGGIFMTPANKEVNGLFYASESLGAKAEKGNFFAAAEFGAGTAATAKLAVGYEIPIGENFGLELSADARAAQSLIGKDIHAEVYAYNEGEVVADNTYSQYILPNNVYVQDNVNVINFKESNSAAGVNVMAKWHPTEKVTLSAGARASVSSTTNAYALMHTDLTSEYNAFEGSNPAMNIHENLYVTGNHSAQLETTVGKKTTKFLVSPKLEFNFKHGKNEFNIGGCLDEGKAEYIRHF